MSYHDVMKRNDRPRSGMYLGGMGTGGAEIRKDGIFYNWRAFNNFPMGTGSRFELDHQSVLFFVVRWKEEGKHPCMKILQIEDPKDCGSIPEGNMYYIMHWMSGVDEIEFEGSFPFAKLTYRDKEMPFDVRCEMMSPFIPHDINNSSIPSVSFNFEIIPKGDIHTDVTLIASLRNCVGYDVDDKAYTSEIHHENDFKAIEMSCEMDNKKSSYGTMTILSEGPNSTYYAGWEHIHPYWESVRDCECLYDVNDTDGRNVTDEKTGKKKAMKRMWSSIANHWKVSNDIVRHRFVFAWDFPNLYAVKSDELSLYDHRPFESDILEGHYHNRLWDTSFKIAKHMYYGFDYLYGASKTFNKTFNDSSLPEAVLNQINSHLPTLVEGTWLTLAGEFGVEEGHSPEYVGGFNTIDVTNYSMVMVECLFPQLAQSILKLSRKQQLPDGHISHHIAKRFQQPFAYETVRRDLPIQYAVLTMRNYLWTNDKDFMKEMWPSVKLAMNYSMEKHDTDNDGIPDMEGVMSSYDNFPMFGVSAFLGSQWLAALKMAVEIAKDMGEEDLSVKYSSLFDKAQKTFEEKLWNGRYFRLSNGEGGKFNDICDDGCLTDQLVGQWGLQWVGMGKIVDEQKIRKALKNILSMSYTEQYGLVNCRWPGTKFVTKLDDDIWVDQANTCWTGVELGFAAFLMYEGYYDEGVKVAANVDRRYTKSGIYWSHVECGDHYNRPLSSWSIINAAAGFSANRNHYTFAPNVPGEYIQLYVSSAYSSMNYSHELFEKKIEVAVLWGELVADSLTFKNETMRAEDIKEISADGTVIPKSRYKVEHIDGGFKIRFEHEIRVAIGLKINH